MSVCAKCGCEVKNPLPLGEGVHGKHGLKEFGHDGIECSEPEVLINENGPYKFPPEIKGYTNRYFPCIARYGKFTLCLKCIPKGYSWGQKEEDNTDKDGS